MVFDELTSHSSKAITNQQKISFSCKGRFSDKAFSVTLYLQFWMNFLFRPMDKHATTRLMLFTSFHINNKPRQQTVHLNRKTMARRRTWIEWKFKVFASAPAASLPPPPPPGFAPPLPFCSHFKSVFVHLHNCEEMNCSGPDEQTEERERERGKITCVVRIVGNRLSVNR